MLFYNFDMLDSFIKSNLISSLKTEKESIKQIINLYNNKKSNLSAITNNMIAITDFIEKNKSDNFYETVTLLKNCFEKINDIQTLASKLDTDLTDTISLYDKSLSNNNDEIKANLVEYNKQHEELFSKILEFEHMNTSIMNLAIGLSLNVSQKKIKKQNRTTDSFLTSDDIKIDVELEPHDSNILIISEKSQKAYLPFFYHDIIEVYQNSTQKYKTLQDVVDDLYVIPLDKFRNSSISRFRESFHLIRDKEKGSITKALDLGLELMFQSNLNPIIISACRNLDELDIYLDCLEQNELYDFTCFAIKFEVSPKIKKHIEQKGHD